MKKLDKSFRVCYTSHTLNNGGYYANLWTATVATIPETVIWIVFISIPVPENWGRCAFLRLFYLYKIFS